MICVLAGGVGAARLLTGLVQVVDPGDIVVIANVADDVELHGLHVSPDLDTITYTLAGQVDEERGWGLRDESWRAMEMVRRYGGLDWFNLGDRDLGTHLYRTHRLGQGATLSEVTAEIIAAWELRFTLLPVTNDELRTRVTVVDPDAEREVGFQEWFVARRHAVPVRSVRFVGATEARAAPGVLDALANADTVVIAPSNPLVSIAPVLAVEEVAAAVRLRRADTVAVSPIVAGAALKGPADRLMADLGHESSVVGVARLYRDLGATLVVDDVDAELAEAVEAAGMSCLVTPTVMTDADASAALARAILDTIGAPSS